MRLFYALPLAAAMLGSFVFADYQVALASIANGPRLHASSRKRRPLPRRTGPGDGPPWLGPLIPALSVGR